MARIHPSTYTLPLSHIQWNVMLAINPEVKGRWDEAARRAITGSGNTVPVEPAIISGNVAYELFASEAAKAHKLATTPAGWYSATGTDRNHQHGRLYNLARPIHSVHSKSLGVLEYAHVYSAFARRIGQTYRSPSPASDESMRTASPQPEDHNESYVSGQFDDAEETSTEINNNMGTVVCGPVEGNIAGDDKNVSNETAAPEVVKAVLTSKIEVAPKHNHGTCAKDDSPTSDGETTDTTDEGPITPRASIDSAAEATVASPVNHKTTTVDGLAATISTAKVDKKEHVPVPPKESVKSDIASPSDPANTVSVLDKAKVVQNPPAKTDPTIAGDAPSGSKKAPTATPAHPADPDEDVWKRIARPTRERLKFNNDLKRLLHHVNRGAAARRGF